MKVVYVSLPNAARIQKFASALIPLDGDFELFTDNCILDARSIMGIFSFDLTKPVKLRIYNDSQENLDALTQFMVEGSDQV